MDLRRTASAQPPRQTEPGASPVAWLIGAGLVVAVFYALTGPGRIDIIDGQHRFDVALNLLEGNGPVLTDPELIRTAVLEPGADGRIYSTYAPGGAVLGLPLLALGKLFGGQRDLLLFCFSLTSALYGGVAAAAHGAILHLHGVSKSRALLSIALLAVASPMWIMGTTVFHQLQFTAFLMLGLLCSFWAAQRNAAGWALAAGLLGGFAIFAQESAGVLVPWLAVPLLCAPSRWARRIWLTVLCAGGALFWLAALLLANQWRFGSALNLAKLDNPNHPPLWGSFRLGFEILTFSVGKSWLLFAPTYALSLAAAAFAWRGARSLVLSVLGLLTTQFLFTCCLTFCAGDWAWGPRYLLAMAPIAGLLLPWLFDRRRWQPLLAVVCASSLAVQLLSVSVDHLRFFKDRHLKRYFWYETPSIYFSESQLLARIGELRDLRLERVPDFVDAFHPGRNPQLSSYAPFGRSPVPMLDYPMFYLPRPWILWMPCVRERLQPAEPLVAAPLLLLLGLGGVQLASSGRSRRLVVGQRWLRGIAERRFVRFVLVGGVCFATNLGILFGGTELLGLHYLASMLVSLIAVNLLGFALHRRWTFESTHNPLLQDAVRYLSANALSTLGVVVCMGVLVELLHVPYLLANVLIALAFLVGNFLLHARWTFRARQRPSLLPPRR